MIKTLGAIALIIFTIMMIGYFLMAPYNDRVMHVGEGYFAIDTVTTHDEWQQGLSGRDEMCERCGMLFLFDETKEHTFWMKDMLFDIDILWILDGEIVHIEENISYETPQKTYRPQQPADTVLELVAGSTEKYNIAVGNTL